MSPPPVTTRAALRRALLAAIISMVAGLALAAAELIAGAFVLTSIAIEARHLFGRRVEHGHAPAARHKTSRVNISNLAAAALGYVEAWHRTHVTGHFKLVSPQIVGATASLFAAFVQSRLSDNRRQRMKPHVAISPAGIRYRENPRRRWRAELYLGGMR